MYYYNIKYSFNINKHDIKSPLHRVLAHVDHMGPLIIMYTIAHTFYHIFLMPCTEIV